MISIRCAAASPSSVCGWHLPGGEYLRSPRGVISSAAEDVAVRDASRSRPGDPGREAGTGGTGRWWSSARPGPARQEPAEADGDLGSSTMDRVRWPIQVHRVSRAKTMATSSPEGDAAARGDQQRGDQPGDRPSARCGSSRSWRVAWCRRRTASGSPDRHAVLGGAVHPIALAHVEGVMEFLEVPDHRVAAELHGRVRVHGEATDRLLDGSCRATPSPRTGTRAAGR